MEIETRNFHDMGKMKTSMFTDVPDELKNQITTILHSLFRKFVLENHIDRLTAWDQTRIGLASTLIRKILTDAIERQKIERTSPKLKAFGLSINDFIRSSMFSLEALDKTNYETSTPLTKMHKSADCVTKSGEPERPNQTYIAGSSSAGLKAGETTERHRHSKRTHEEANPRTTILPSGGFDARNRDPSSNKRTRYDAGDSEVLLPEEHIPISLSFLKVVSSTPTLRRQEILKRMVTTNEGIQELANVSSLPIGDAGSGMTKSWFGFYSPTLFNTKTTSFSDRGLFVTYMNEEGLVYFIMRKSRGITGGSVTMTRYQPINSDRTHTFDESASSRRGSISSFTEDDTNDLKIFTRERTVYDHLRFGNKDAVFLYKVMPLHDEALEVPRDFAQVDESWIPVLPSIGSSSTSNPDQLAKVSFALPSTNGNFFLAIYPRMGIKGLQQFSLFLQDGLGSYTVTKYAAPYRMSSFDRIFVQKLLKCKVVPLITLLENVDVSFIVRLLQERSDVLIVGEMKLLEARGVSIELLRFLQARGVSFN